MGQKRDQRQHVLERINLHASGIDVGATGHHVAVPPGSSPDGRDVRECGAFTEDLIGIVEWLQACGVTTVAMESTGVYWIPLYDLLDAHGLDVHLVDPRQLKRVPGRKTDILDCQWLQQMHSYGLLSGSFGSVGCAYQRRIAAKARGAKGLPALASTPSSAGSGAGNARRRAST